MSPKRKQEMPSLAPDAEPERYELFEEPLYQFDVDRREFLRVLGGGILVCLTVGETAAQPRQRPGA